MKKTLLTGMFLLGTGLMLNAANLPSSPYTWNGAGFPGDNTITVKSGQMLTIDYTNAPSVNIIVQTGGICEIIDMESSAGGTITVKPGGKLNIYPKSNDTDITIGQDVILEEFMLNAINSSSILALAPYITNPMNTQGICNIGGNGNVSKVTFSGNLNLGAGCAFNINYPDEKTAENISFNNLTQNMTVVPSEFMTMLASSIPAQYSAYTSANIIPPVLNFGSEAKLPAISGNMNINLKFLSILVDLDDDARDNIALLQPAAALILAGFPNKTYNADKTIDLSLWAVPAPNSYSDPISIALSVYEAGTYTVKFPAVPANDNSSWCLFDGTEKKADLSVSGSTYPVYISGLIYSNLSFQKVNNPTSINTASAEKGEITSTQYYTITGIEVVNPVSGIFVKKSIYSNGTIETQKVVLK